MKKEIVEKVLQRAKGYCEKCGGVGETLSLHHRKLKSQGGKDDVSNLIAVHPNCHNQHKDSIHDNPKKSKVKGWIVPSWADSNEYPLHLPDGTIVKLDNEGSYERMAIKWQE